MSTIDPNLFVTMFNSLITASMSHAGALVSEGVDLTWKLFGVMLAWALFQVVLSDSFADGFATIMNLAAKTAFVLFLLNSWNDGFVSNFFTSTMDEVARKAAGDGTTGAAGITIILSSMNSVLQQGSTSSVKCQTVDAPTYDPTTGVQIGTGTTTNCTNTQGGWDTMLKVLGSPLMWFVGILLKTLVIGLLALLAAVYMLITNIGAILVGVGMTLGPILVPWILMEAASFLFDGWLKFTLASGLIKVVGAVLMAIVNAGITSMQSFAVTYLEDASTIDTFALVLMAIMTCIAIFLMWQAPQIAGSLVGGGSSARAGGFGKGAIGKKFTPSFLKR